MSSRLQVDVVHDAIRMSYGRISMSTRCRRAERWFAVEGGGSETGFRPVRRSIALVLVVAAGGAAVASTAFGDSPGAQPEIVESQPAIVIPLSLYVVRTEDDRLSSRRTTDELLEISDRIGEIWALAGIIFDPIEIAEITAPARAVIGLSLGDARPFLEQAGTTFDIPAPGLVNGFYIRNAGGVNGFMPFGTRVFFVDDSPTVHDQRVSSHEVGHIFGLSHDLEDPGRLMFSGTNGMTLTLDERVTARGVASELLDDLR